MKTYRRLAAATAAAGDTGNVVAVLNGDERLYIVIDEIDPQAAFEVLGPSDLGGWAITGWVSVSRVTGNLNLKLAPATFVAPVELVTMPAMVDGCRYANKHLYSDIEPYEIVRVVSGRKIIVRTMKCTVDPEWRMDWRSGGFGGQLANSSDQRWIIESDPDGKEITLTLRGDGKWRLEKHGYNEFVLSVEPMKFYDWNF